MINVWSTILVGLGTTNGFYRKRGANDPPQRSLKVGAGKGYTPSFLVTRRTEILSCGGESPVVNGVNNPERGGGWGGEKWVNGHHSRTHGNQVAGPCERRYDSPCMDTSRSDPAHRTRPFVSSVTVGADERRHTAVRTPFGTPLRPGARITCEPCSDVVHPSMLE